MVPLLSVSLSHPFMARDLILIAPWVRFVALPLVLRYGSPKPLW